ncbi:Peptidyl-dipeptidase A [Maricaulis maris MCS10]|uniref:Peptidyl-dipeptidase A n=1 Tax=Maricaulis maris (strain MCS10) TaxID=394221 RepID=Q0APM8_MARMM|nr:M2 family metallopeptidase [Maricaulis maris]ABI65759.1 Peptidyl-dipeptidase A [Maricaulis maris MCS10]
MKRLMTGVASGALLAVLAGCSAPNEPAADTQAAAPATASPVTVADAEQFLADATTELREFSEFGARTAWVQNNFITYDTNWLLERMSTQGTEMAVRLATETARFNELEMTTEMSRQMNVLRAGITLPAPSDSAAAARLSELTTRMGSAYSTGLMEIDGEMVDHNELENIMRTSRDPEFLSHVWAGWRDSYNPEQMSTDYAEMVEIANAGARDLGFSDLAEMWLSNYDMPADEMEAEVERLWGQVEPLYEQLHCAVRSELNGLYGDEVQAAEGPIRADLLGNMWAQSWAALADVASVSDAGPAYDLTQLLVDADYDQIRMVETAETFFTSLGMEELPDTFWERSLITQPRDRQVACHASAWNLDSVDDLRIKMCTRVNADDFVTVHHELGHNFYQRAYNQQDFLFQGGAHDGFHEAIGDFIALSVTPDYLVQIGLLDQADVPDASADLGLLMDTALDKIAFLPFAVMMDQWRWRVLRGEIQPDSYNDAWWELRESYQGIVPPVERGETAFDPGSKYHIANNVPYLRYFLSFIMQFQFHEAACEMAGWEGPLHRCSIYGNEEVGARFSAMMEMGASQPWPDALEAFTGTREMDGSAIIAYFQPLMTHLEEQNATRDCGW